MGQQSLKCCCSDSVEATTDISNLPPTLSTTDEQSVVMNVATIVQRREPCCSPINGIAPALAHGPTGQPFVMCGLATDELDAQGLREKLLEFFESDHAWRVKHDDTWQIVLRDEPSCRNWALTSSCNPGADGSTSLKVAMVTPMHGDTSGPNMSSSEFVLSWTNDDMELNFDFRCFEIRVRLVHASQTFREVLSSVTQLRLCYDLVSDDKPFHFALVGTIDPQITVTDLQLRVYWWHEFMWQSKELGFTTKPPQKPLEMEKFGL